KTIAMTTLQKTLATTVAAILVGTGIYQARQAANARAEIQALQQQQSSLTGQISQIESERDQATNQLAGLLAENFRRKSMSKENETELLKLRSQVAQLQRIPPPATDADPFTQSVLALAGRAAQLNQYLQQMPDKKIPELRLLDESDWLNVAKKANFDTDAGIRKALQKLRSLAKAKVPIGSALSAFANANNGQLPADLSQLRPYFDRSNLGDLGLDDSAFNSIIARYTLLHTGSVKDYPPNTWFVAETAPVDKDYDSREKFGLGTSSIFTTGLNESGDPDDSSY
ncbi:MAG TPA: hypothetical protein VH251_11210, partial [Verrucomicrobiae bacterium]|nr:hypothetical protein [Verrucomicrobiae bacterium]